MSRLVRFLLFGYLFFQSWTNAFALSEHFPVHVVLGALAVGAFVLLIVSNDRRLTLRTIKPEDGLIVILVFLVTAAAVFHTRSTSLNYVAAYGYVFVVGYLGVKVALDNCVPTSRMMDWVLLGVVVTAVGSIAEFCAEFLLGLDANKFLFRWRPEISTYAGVIPRSAAFSNEPGILAFYMETLGVIALWHLWRKDSSNALKIGVTLLIVSGWALSFSAASVAALMVAGLAVLSVKAIRSERGYERLLPFVLVPIVLAAGVVAMGVLRETFMGEIVAKLTLNSGANASVAQRIGRWLVGFQQVVKRPLGVGPGTAAAHGQIGNLSWYLFLAVESGLLAVAVVWLFLLSRIIRFLRSPFEGKYWFLAAFIAGTTHLAVISTFFHPFLWTLVGVWDVITVRRLELSSGEGRAGARRAVGPMRP